MLNILLPLVQTALAAFGANKGAVAKAAGTTPEVVEAISAQFEAYLTQDERFAKLAAAQIEAARAHDIATQVKDIPAVNLTRGLVRPIITFTAFGWYVYARYKGLPLAAEDYAIIGGVLAFWFGFRPFEKQRAGRSL